MVLFVVILLAVIPGLGLLEVVRQGETNDVSLTSGLFGVWSFLVGSSFVWRRPGSRSVAAAQWFLWSRPVVYLCLTALYLQGSFFYSEVMFGSGEDVFARAFVFSLIFAVIWSLYLSRAERVRNTYRVDGYGTSA